MSTKRKPMRSKSAMPEKPVPTSNQIEEAMIAFEKLKMRYRLEGIPWAPEGQQYIVRVLPEMMVGTTEFAGVKGLPPITDKPPPASATMTIHRFPDEASARQWREREIIRETITAGMRAKP